MALVVNSVLLTASTTSYECLKVDAILLTVCFLIAIDRALELLGGSKSGVLFPVVRQGARVSSGRKRHQ